MDVPVLCPMGCARLSLQDPICSLQDPPLWTLQDPFGPSRTLLDPLGPPPVEDPAYDHAGCRKGCASLVQ